MIITANAYFSMTWEQYNRSIVAPLLARYGLIPETIAEGELIAYINHGHWLVMCECGGAEKMWEEGVFMCQSCQNAGYKHQYRKSAFPKARKQIEALLLRRPVPNRNWHPGESLALLKRENEEHREELL